MIVLYLSYKTFQQRFIFFKKTIKTILEIYLIHIINYPNNTTK